MPEPKLEMCLFCIRLLTRCTIAIGDCSSSRSIFWSHCHRRKLNSQKRKFSRIGRHTRSSLQNSRIQNLNRNLRSAQSSSPQSSNFFNTQEARKLPSRELNKPESKKRHQRNPQHLPCHSPNGSPSLNKRPRAFLGSRIMHAFLHLMFLPGFTLYSPTSENSGDWGWQQSNTKQDAGTDQQKIPAEDFENSNQHSGTPLRTESQKHDRFLNGARKQKNKPSTPHHQEVDRGKKNLNGSLEERRSFPNKHDENGFERAQSTLKFPDLPADDEMRVHGREEKGKGERPKGNEKAEFGDQGKRQGFVVPVEKGGIQMVEDANTSLHAPSPFSSSFPAGTLFFFFPLLFSIDEKL